MLARRNMGNQEPLGTCYHIQRVALNNSPLGTGVTLYPAFHSRISYGFGSYFFLASRRIALSNRRAPRSPGAPSRSPKKIHASRADVSGSHRVTILVRVADVERIPIIKRP